MSATYVSARKAKIANQTNINQQNTSDKKKIDRANTKARADTQVRPYGKSFNGSRR